MKERKGLFGDTKFPDVEVLSSEAHKNAALDHLQALLFDLEQLASQRTDQQPFLGNLAEPTGLDFDCYGAFWLAGVCSIGKDLFPPAPFKEGHSTVFPEFSKYLQFMGEKVAEWKAANPPIETVDFTNAEQLTPHLISLPPLPPPRQFRDFAGLESLIGQQVSLLARDTGKQAQEGILKYVDAQQVAIEWVSPITGNSLRAWASKQSYIIKQ
jgi:hypothetical protein